MSFLNAATQKPGQHHRSPSPTFPCAVWTVLWAGSPSPGPFFWPGTNHGTILEPPLTRRGNHESQVIKRSVKIDGHKTSICLEDAFWSSLKSIAQAQGATVAQMVTTIKETRKQSNLSSSVRLFVLDYVRNGQMGKQV